MEKYDKTRCLFSMLIFVTLRKTVEEFEKKSNANLINHCRKTSIILRMTTALIFPRNWLS